MTSSMDEADLHLSDTTHSEAVPGSCVYSMTGSGTLSENPSGANMEGIRFWHELECMASKASDGIVQDSYLELLESWELKA